MIKINRIITLFIAIFLSVSLISIKAHSSMSFNINNSSDLRTKIMLYRFEAEDVGIQGDIEELMSRIHKNLQTTNLFDIANKSPSQYKKTSKLLVEKIPDFAKYKASGVGALLVGSSSVDLDGNLELKVRLWDVLDEKQLFGKFYSASKENYKKMANLVSNEIFKSITGEKSGHFDSKIVYISESGHVKKRRKRIAMIDFDGENRKYLTSGTDLVLTPIFSKNPEELIFLRYFKNVPQIHKLNIENKIISKIGDFDETTFAPNVHPINPNLIVFSLIKNGNSDIYEINMTNDQVKRLTYNKAIDTTPSYSPDGSKIVFSSDRTGSQKIYVMNSDGTQIKKISKKRGSYSKPVWSPDGSLVAFTKLRRNKFGIGLMSPDGRNEKIIASGYLVEGAKWSPNGRYLIYSRKDASFGRRSVPKLYTIDILTGYERLIPTSRKEGATDPDWANSW